MERSVGLVSNLSYLLLDYLCVSLDYTLLEMALATDHTGLRDKFLTITLNGTPFMGNLLQSSPLSDLLHDSTTPSAQTFFPPFPIFRHNSQYIFVSLTLFHHLLSKRSGNHLKIQRVRQNLISPWLNWLVIETLYWKF